MTMFQKQLCKNTIELVHLLLVLTVPPTILQGVFLTVVAGAAHFEDDPLHTEDDWTRRWTVKWFKFLFCKNKKHFNIIISLSFYWPSRSGISKFVITASTIAVFVKVVVKFFLRESDWVYTCTDATDSGGSIDGNQWLEDRRDGGRLRCREGNRK